jgi:glycerate kinase
MRVLVAFDKFKDSLSAREACGAAARALRSVHPDWRLDVCPLSDGGDGFAEILTAAAGGELRPFQVAGPRGGMVPAPLGLVQLSRLPSEALALLALPGPSPAAGALAVVEMASASGLALLPKELRDPWQTSSYGTGQLVRAAAECGAAAVLIGVGGSGTHDLGLGALSALGLEFRTGEGRIVRTPVPARWPELADMVDSLFPSIPPIRIACDVSNPLLGPEGAAAVFAPQKGLRPADFERLESESARMAALLCDSCGQPRTLANLPGAGAAGGFAFGLMAGARAQLLPGFALVAAWLDLEARLAAADMVLTGEGRFDRTSLGGKGPGGLAARAAALGKTIHVFAGQVDWEGVRLKNLTSETEVKFFNLTPSNIHAITPPGTSPVQALRDSAANLAAAVQRVLAGC